MRRLMALVAAAVALTGTPAGAAPSGELVIVADGPAYGSLTMPRTIALDLPRAIVEASHYAVLVVMRPGSEITAFGYRAPGFEQLPFARNGTHQFERGRSEVRLLTRGRTTIRIPAPGLGTRVTLRLGRRLAGTAAEFRPLGGLVGPTASEVPFATGRRRMLVLHGALLRYTAAVEYDTRMCVVATGPQCAESVMLPVSPGTTSARLQVAHVLDAAPTARGTFQSTILGMPSGPGQHYVLALPLA